MFNDELRTIICMYSTLLKKKTKNIRLVGSSRP